MKKPLPSKSINRTLRAWGWILIAIGTVLAVRWTWMLSHGRLRDAETGTRFTVWLVTLLGGVVLAVPTPGSWRPQRGRSNACPHCGYSLTGLAKDAGGACPEYGKARPMEEKTKAII